MKKRRNIRLYPDKPLGEPVRRFEDTFSAIDLFNEELAKARRGEKSYFDR